MCVSHLLVTRDEGKTWRDITPERTEAGDWTGLQPFFLDRSHVWVTAEDCAGGKALLLGSDDGGRTWRSTPAPAVSCAAGSLDEADFVDPMHGFLANLEPTGPGASLRRSLDGGVTWTRVGRSVLGGLPLVAAPVFTSPSDGWVGGGPFAWGSLYSTNDGGRHWHLVVGTHARVKPHALADIPTPTDGSLILPLTVRQGDHVMVRFETSTNGGESWITLDTVRVHLRPRSRAWPFRSLPRPLPVSVVDANAWWIAAGSTVYRTRDGGRTWATHRSLVPTRSSISAIDGSTAWVVSNENLVVTHDGGRSWSILLPR